MKHRTRLLASLACAIAALPLTGSVSAAPLRLPEAPVRDVEARDRLFQRGLPVTAESFSPDGFHYAYLHVVPGGFIRRKPVRCTFLLDLQTGDNRPLRAPKGIATRVGGWDATGRNLLIETEEKGWLSPLTGSWNTIHWIFDVVTFDFVKRRPFTGLRDGQPFRWRQQRDYHGVWDEQHDAKVRPTYEGELVRMYQARARDLDAEDERRRALAARLAVGFAEGEMSVFADVLEALDRHWTQRGQRDPVISDLFGDRPTLHRLGEDGAWEPVHEEMEHVAILDHGLALLTGRDGEQFVYHAGRGELLPLPTPPDDWAEQLHTRWNRSGGFYDEFDPLPRDGQYRRSWDEGQGTAYYFHYVKSDLSHLFLVYSFSPTKRVLRVVDLPKEWRPVPAGTSRPSVSAEEDAEASG